MNRNFVATTSKENSQMDSNGMERNRRHYDEVQKTKDGEIFQQLMPKKARSSYDAATISPYKQKLSSRFQDDLVEVQKEKTESNIEDSIEYQENKIHLEEVAEDEPDWDALGDNEPAARQQVELFLRTREIRDEADERFSTVMDECHTLFETAKKRILQAAADVHNMHRDELDYLETEIKQTLVWNHQVRTKMRHELEESRARAQGMFSQLLLTVSHPM